MGPFGLSLDNLRTFVVFYFLDTKAAHVLNLFCSMEIKQEQKLRALQEEYDVLLGIPNLSNKGPINQADTRRCSSC